MMLLSILLLGFTEYDKDNLFRYQWALKNNGNFLIDRGILAANHNVMYFNKQVADNIFFDSADYVQYFKSYMYNPGIAYAKSSCDIKWREGYDIFSQSPYKRDVVVAIIDTGIDITHEELANNIWVNEDEVPGNGIDDDYNGYIDDVFGYNFYNRSSDVFVDPNVDIHGTHAAGTIVAKHGNGGIKGIAYDSHVKIMTLKVLGENGQGYMSSVVEAINYAKRNGANICNISLGAYTYEETLDNAIKNSPEMLFIVAAGNGANYVGYSLDDKDVFPAKFNYPNVITVSNTCFDEDRYVSANYGSYVDIFAPGTLVLSTVPNGTYGFFTGTSMAAPFVSATCAMIYSAYPKVPIEQYKGLIINGATPVQKFVGLSKSSGILNVYNTLLFASIF